MNINTPLLSICIPTYNRADKLKISLNAILNASKNHKTLVEIIVSDNYSDDNTQEIVSAFKDQNDNLYYYRNSINLGFIKNLFLLTDVYANGKYCWVIGDDDYVDIDSITHILSILQRNEKLKLLVVNFRFLFQNEYETFPLNSELREKICFLNGSFAKAVDSIISSGNLLGTFISCHIFYKNLFSEFPKGIFSADSLDNFQSTFPNAYILANQLVHTSVIYTLEPLITCVPHKKSWDDKIQYIFSDPVPKLYDYYLSLGYSKKDLVQTRKMIIFMNLSNVFSNLLNMKAITKGQIKLSLLSIFYPSIYFLMMKRLIKKAQ